MIEIPIGMAASEEVVVTALTRLKNGKIDDAIARFAEEFRFSNGKITDWADPSSALRDRWRVLYEMAELVRLDFPLYGSEEFGSARVLS
jgi:hypothetical protein